MDYLCCGELAEEERIPPPLSEAIINAMQTPHETLDVPPESKPWTRRDAFRRNCVRLLAHNEWFVESLLVDDGVPGGRRPVPHAAALVAYKILDARGRARLDQLLQRLPRLVADGHFEGRPSDVLHALRGPPGTRACAMLRCVCVAARAEEDAWTLMLEVDYCARTSVVPVDAARLARCFRSLRRFRKLAAALEAPPDGSPAKIGRLVARAVSKTHADLSRKGVYSQELASILGLDPARVWREEEPRIAALLDPPARRSPNDTVYLVSSPWLLKWREWVTTPDAPPPGPVDVTPRFAAAVVVVSASLWAYFEAVHGKTGGPRLARRRGSPSLDDPRVLPARPVAVAILQRAARRRPPHPRVPVEPPDLPRVVDKQLPDLPRPGEPACGVRALCSRSPSHTAEELELVPRRPPTISPLHQALADID